jgi:hypothetical protein
LGKHRDHLVRRVVHALEDTHDPDSLVWRYFDEERDVVIEAARQTLEATREDVSTEKVASVVDKELIEALRVPEHPRRGVAVSIYLHRGRAALATALVTIGTLLAFLLI